MFNFTSSWGKLACCMMFTQDFKGRMPLYNMCTVIGNKEEISVNINHVFCYFCQEACSIYYLALKGKLKEFNLNAPLQNFRVSSGHGKPGKSMFFSRSGKSRGIFFALRPCVFSYLPIKENSLAPLALMSLKVQHL